MDNQNKNTRESCVGNDEVQIEARYGMPLVGDRAFPGAVWYKVDAQTGIVTIHYFEDGKKPRSLTSRKLSSPVIQLTMILVLRRSVSGKANQRITTQIMKTSCAAFQKY